MKILVANLGSTSFKYRLFRFEGADAHAVAKGGVERVEDFDEAIDQALQELRGSGHLRDDRDLDAVAFKAVLGKDLSGCVEADERCLSALEQYASLAPAHNPAYMAGIRAFARRLPGARRVALFETAFYQWVDEAAARYAVPQSWHDAGIRRFGFHGASHKFIAERSAELSGRRDLSESVQLLYREGPPQESGPPFRVISCHLGGSSSVTGIRNGVAVGTSMGMSPQSGLPQNNRVGDLDSAAIPHAVRTFGLDLEGVERVLTRESGLLGLSGGVSNDLRDIRQAAEAGNQAADLALRVFVLSIRRWIGAFFMEMGGAEALVFTAGIGEHQAGIREAVCRGWEELGIRLDAERNRNYRGGEERISREDSAVAVWVIPTNEELVVARETWRLIRSGKTDPGQVTRN